MLKQNWDVKLHSLPVGMFFHTNHQRLHIVVLFYGSLLSDRINGLFFCLAEPLGSKRVQLVGN